MAVELEVGKIYTAHAVRTGTSNRGDWEMVKVKEKTKEITVWPDNSPTGIVEGQQFEVVSIRKIKYGARKRGDGKWWDEVTAEAVLKPASTSSFDFSESAGDEANLPWSLDDSAFSIPEDDKLPL